MRFMYHRKFIADFVNRFTAGMIDALNAEIALGTVANLHDAIQWLQYTYLYVRMRKNPLQYGTSLVPLPPRRVTPINYRYGLG